MGPYNLNKVQISGVARPKILGVIDIFGKIVEIY
jgi:hypothetical protein